MTGSVGRARRAGATRIQAGIPGRVLTLGVCYGDHGCRSEGSGDSTSGRPGREPKSGVFKRSRETAQARAHGFSRNTLLPPLQNRFPLAKPAPNIAQSPVVLFGDAHRGHTPPPIREACYLRLVEETYPARRWRRRRDWWREVLIGERLKSVSSRPEGRRSEVRERGGWAGVG